MASCAVELVEQHSRAACTAGTSYGCASDTAVWTSCRGRFRCAGGPEFACGYPPGKPRYSCRCDGADDWLVASTRPRGARHSGARVAVCLFGQTRDHFAGGERSVHAQMRSTILNATALGVPVDVFVDTWAETWGRDERGGRVDINWHAEFGKPLVALTVERTPPDASLLLNGLRLPTHVVREAPLYYSGTLPLLWKLRGCAAAIGRWENASGFEYAAVLSARMDAKFWTEVVAQRLVETTRAILAGAAGPSSLFFVNTGSLILSRQLGDKYAVGTSAAMRYYLDAWSRAEALWRAAPGAPLVGERLMHAHIADAPFNVTAIGLKGDNRRIGFRREVSVRENSKSLDRL